MNFGVQMKEEDLFRGFPAERQSFRALSVRRQLKKGEFIFYEDDPGDSCYYLQEGMVKIFRITTMGKEPILMIRKAGEIFGLAEAIGGFERKTSAQAIRSSVIYQMDGQTFEDFLSRNYPIARRIMAVLGKRLRYLCEQVGNLMVCDVTTRLLKHLVYSCSSTLMASDALDQPVTFSLDLTQEQLASMTGSCQQTVCETLRKLQEEGLIEVTGKEITLPDPLKIIRRIEN